MSAADCSTVRRDTELYSEGHVSMIPVMYTVDASTL